MNQTIRTIRRPEVCRKTGLGRSTIHNLEVAGNFPQHRMLTPRCAVWVEAEIDAWLRARLASPRAMPARNEPRP